MFQEEENRIIWESLQKSEGENGPDGSSGAAGDGPDSRANVEDIAIYKYPFENLIFEGGGNKGMAYCGAIKCLEDVGVLPQIKRIGGTSAGAITAAFLALGYTSSEMEVCLQEIGESLVFDHAYGILSLLPNLIIDWGWNPGRRVHQWIGEKIQSKTGNADLTFHELYKLKGIELCAVITNVNQMRAEYCHPKTTPNMSIREALRMSMSIPVLFSPCKQDNCGYNDTYVDGGILCNYPIQCFDGWYLSMEKNDAFLLHMHELDDLSQIFSVRSRFQPRHQEHESSKQKSLGFLLYNDTEIDVMTEILDKRTGAVKPDKPSKETVLYKNRLRVQKVQHSLKNERERSQQAAEAFIKALMKYNIDDVLHIDKGELKKALEDTSAFSDQDRQKLFGKSVSLDEAFEYLDMDRNGKIDFQELFRFLERKNIRIQTRIQGYRRSEITNFIEFSTTLHRAQVTNLKYIYLEDNDYRRTVGINTGHLGTTDYNIEKEDVQFMLDRGYNATAAFLRYFIENNAEKMVKKPVVDQDK